MTWLRMITLIIFVIVFLLWAGQNLENRVDINSFKGNTVANAPLWIVVLVSVAFGMFFMGILGIAQEVKDKNALKKLEKKLDKQRQELSSLRNLPISDDIEEEAVPEAEQTAKTEN